MRAEEEDSSVSSYPSSESPRVRPLLVPRVRPLYYHRGTWNLECTRPAGDIACFVLFPSLGGILGSSREGSRLLLLLQVQDIAHLVARDILRCLRFHLAIRQ